MSKHELPSTSTNTREHVPAWRRFAALGLLSSVALTGCAAQHVNAEAPTSSPVPSAAASETPSTAETTESQADKIKAIEIPANLSDEELSTVTMSRIDDWTNAGNNENLMTRLLQPNVTRDSLAEEVSKENEEIYASALFGPNWKSKPTMVQAADDMSLANSSTIRAYTSVIKNTAYTPNHQGYAYKQWSEVLSVTGVPGVNSSRYLKITYKNYDNADGSVIPSDAINKIDPMLATVSFIPGSDGSEIITNLAFTKADS